jgi:hypothetical protein
MHRVMWMKTLRNAILVMPLVLLGVESTNADIYVWTDESGIKHITNYAPPEHAHVLLRTPEIPYDAEADRQRREAEQRERLAREKRELAEQEARLELLEREASARMAAAEQLRREMSAYEKGREDQARESSTTSRSYWYGGPIWYGGWGRHPGYGRNGYYRKNGSIFYKQRRPHHPHKPKIHHPQKPHKKIERVDKHTSSRPPDHSFGARTPYPSARQPYKGPHAYQRRY